MRTLDHDGSLFLRLEDESTDEFTQTAFYKLSVRRYVSECFPGLIRFRNDLNYPDYKKLIGIFEREAEKSGGGFRVSDALSDYISGKELHVGIRSRLGHEIKNRDGKLNERFESYRAAVDSLMVRPLRERQMWDSFFMYSMRKSANFSVPGSGKTASVLGVYAYLKSTGSVRRLLVVCPKNAFGSWMDEFGACFGNKEPLRIFNFHDPHFASSNERRNALKYDSGSCNLILVNYEAVGACADLLREMAGNETLLVFDEVHKVKRVGGSRAADALYIARDANFVIALTGTPIPNSYTDIYNLLNILFPDEYGDFFGFEPSMLKDPAPAEAERVNEKLSPFFCRTTKRQLGVPEADPDNLIDLAASETESRIKQVLAMKYRRNKLALMIRLLQLESDPSALLRNLDLADFAYLLDEDADISEIDFADYSTEIKALIESCSGGTTKFRACAELAEGIASEGHAVIIWCIFLDSIRNLAAELKKRGIPCRCIYGEVELAERQSILEDFKSGRVKVLITNPHTLAESVSLHSVCHDAIYFEYSYNLVHLLQSKDRIHRLGLPEGQRTSYYYMRLFYPGEDGAWSMDAAIYDRLREKERIMLEAIDRDVLETLPTSEEELDLIFADMK